MQPAATTNPFMRYLAAKRSVDDRALNRHVWETLKALLAVRAGSSPLRILEIGAGIGTMIERIVEWNLTSQPVHYTALDSDTDSIAEARRRLTSHEKPGQFHPELEAINLFDFIEREQENRVWDVVIAHAFLDLIDIPTWLPAILSLLADQGLFYFTLNFDGMTLLEPGINPALDAQIMDLYHQTMDRRVVDGLPSGDSQTGRHMFAHLKAAGGEVLAAGASDWVVFPVSGAYPGDEAYFLHFIVNTIHSALNGHPALNTGQFDHWIAERRAQIDRAEMIYIAHQIDFVGRRSAAS